MATGETKCMLEGSNGDETVSELELWLDILHEANAVHAQLPESVRDEIDAAASPRELTRLIVHMAAMSTATRRRVETTLLRLLCGEPVSQPEGHVPPLYLVAPAGR